MSKMKAPVWYPPQFPLQGRLPQTAAEVGRNQRLQEKLERDYQDALSVAAGARRQPPCCRTLHISLFFDGTGNNLNNDVYESAVAHPTNIARLFRATIGAGHAGGTGHRGTASDLTDVDGTGYGQFYKYYMPGVGTPFPEVGDLDYSSDGLAFARRGEERINWALLMIIDALRRALKLPRRNNAALKDAVESMGAWGGTEWIKGRINRANVLRKELKALEGPLHIALNPSLGHPKLLGVRLWVFGFSRGAAAARAFVNWLNHLLAPQETTPTLLAGEAKLPISVAYLGLLDTVVSVGVADISPGANGHMGWGDGSQEMPRGKLVERCLHLVASHEQRLSFPLDSIRREDGTYPDNSVEVIYPGMHSDQGGGYPPGDQGKAVGENDGWLLSQIALHDLYSDAFSCGAPLKVSADVLPIEMKYDKWRAMSANVFMEFTVAPHLVERFNAWRLVTLGMVSGHQPSDIYNALPSSSTLEDALRNQMDWLTAWRIDRYGFGSLKNTAFYHHATDEHATTEARQKAEAERNAKQAEIEKRRELQAFFEHRGAEKKPLEPGVKDFDPDKSKTQLREAAEEFGRHYRDANSDPYLAFVKNITLLRWVSLPALVAHWNLKDKLAEHQRMKEGGQGKVSQLFPPPRGRTNHTSETERGPVDESLNQTQPTGLLRALFDDQVHDSRAWFLHALLNQQYVGQNVAVGREPWGSYFTERMVFFSEANRRDVALVPVPGEHGGTEMKVAAAGNDTTSPPLTSEQRRAQIEKRMAAIWSAPAGQAQGEQDA